MRTLSTLACILCVSVKSSIAAVSINWQSTGALSAGESVINTDGALEYAYNLGDATTYTVNTVEFKGTAAGAVSDLAGEGNVLWAPADNGSNANFSNLTGDFGSMMDSATWGLSNTETTITLSNLADGQAYVLQLFTSDVRGTRNNTLVLDTGTANEYSSTGTGSVANGGGDGAYVTGVLVADATGQATFTFRYLSASGNANINALQLRKVPRVYIKPGIGLTIEDLENIKANLTVEPWLTGYNDLLASPQSDLSYVPFQDGTITEVSRTLNDNGWEADMTAVHNMARLWYFTGNAAYAQKARDILISWAETHTVWLPGETYLTMGYNAFRVFEGADILRGTWPGWTQADTDTCKAYFENVWWDEYHIAVPNPLRSANQGMANFTPALGVAVFNEDDVKFEQCLEVFRTDAPAALLSSLPNGQIGDSGRDAHDQGQLMLMAWAAEVFHDQGVDVFAEYDNRLLAAAEYISRYNLLVDIPFIQAGTVYDVYPIMHYFQSDGIGGRYAFETKMISMLYGAYVVQKGMRSPYLEKYLSYATQDSDSFCYLKPIPSASSTLEAPVTGAAPVASVTSLNNTHMGDTYAGSSSYNAGSKIWTVSGNGTNMWYSSVPDYNFAYLPVTGDATIIAKLTGLSGGSSEDARAGLVFSTDLTDSADMQAIIVTHPGGSDPQMHSFRRGDVAHSHQGNSGSRSYPRQSSPKIPYWLKIERIGNRVNCYSSPDGANWSCGESADYDVGATAYFGLAVSSDQTNSQSTATFTDVRITGGDGGETSDIPEAPFAIYASPGGDEIPLRWLESFEADSYKIWRATQSGGPYTLVTQQSGTSYIDTNVVPGTYYYYAISAVNSLGESPLSPEEQLHFPDTAWHEAEDYDAQSGIQTQETRDYFGGRNVGWINDSDWCRYDDIQIHSGAYIKARVAGYGDPAEVAQIEVRVGSETGTVIGTIDIVETGGVQLWDTTPEIPLSVAPGTYDLYLVFQGVTPGGSPGININWFDITYPGITQYELGAKTTVTFNPAIHELTNRSGVIDWNSSSIHLQLQDGSDLTNIDFAAMGITSWTTSDFGIPTTTTWDGANLSGITLHASGNFGDGDSFTGADFSGMVWGTATSTADLFGGGSGASSAATANDAIDLSGADLSLITGAARTAMITNLGGFDGPTPIGAKIDPAFIANSGWDQAALIAAGWQLDSSLLAHWTFDEGSGSSTTADITGNGHDGSLSNTSWVSGYQNHGLEFNGSSSQVTNIGSAFSSINDQITISLWSYGDSSQPIDNSIIYAVNSSGGRVLNVHLPFGNGQIYWDAGDSGYDRINKAASAAEYKDSWAHWVFTKNANTGDMNIYRNGTLWHSGTGKTKTMTGITAATIGSQISGAYYTGSIDDVRLYDVELDATEVANLYASYPPSPTYTLTYTAGSNGSITGTSPQTVSDGNDGTEVTAVPSTNYHFVDWSDANTANPRTDLNVTGNVTVTANFTIDTYTLTYNTDGNGSISGTNPQTIDHGADGTAVTAVADTNYSFVNWSDGSTDNPRTDLSITDDVTVTANFEEDNTELESWRFTHFGTYENTGTAADDFDADFDGILNLVEYATGTDPNSPGISSFRIRPSVGSGFEVRFDRILDSSLNYTVEGVDNPGALIWTPVWTGSGTSADEVIVPDTLWPSGTKYFLRLNVSY